MALTPEQIQKNKNTYMNTRATPEQIAHMEACRAKRRLILEEINNLNKTTQFEEQDLSDQILLEVQAARNELEQQALYWGMSALEAQQYAKRIQQQQA